MVGQTNLDEFADPAPSQAPWRPGTAGFPHVMSESKRIKILGHNRGGTNHLSRQALQQGSDDTGMVQRSKGVRVTSKKARVVGGGVRWNGGLRVWTADEYIKHISRDFSPLACLNGQCEGRYKRLNAPTSAERARIEQIRA